MKRLYGVFLVLVVLFISGCGYAVKESSDVSSLSQSTNNSNKEYIKELENKIRTLETEINELQGTFDQVKAERDNLILKSESKEKETKVQDGDVSVIVTGKKNIPENIDKWRFSNESNFTFTITNKTDKNIQGIQGILDINDLFGENIISLSCDFTGDIIKAGQSIINDRLSLEINEFIDEHKQIYSTDFKDLKFKYNTTKIVFEDGSVKE